MSIGPLKMSDEASLTSGASPDAGSRCHWVPSIVLFEVMWTYAAPGVNSHSASVGIRSNGAPSGQARHVDVPDPPGLLDGLLGPGAGVDVVRRRALGQEVHRDHGELEARAALQEQDLVAVRDAGQPADVRLGLAEDRLEGRRAMADLHDGHADAGQRHEVALDLLEHGQRQDGRAGREVVDAVRGGHGRAPQMATSWRLRMSSLPPRWRRAGRPSGRRRG